MSNAKLEKKLCLAKETPEPIFDVSDCGIKRIPNGIFSAIKVLRKEVLFLQNNKLSSLKEGGNLRDLYLLRMFDLSSNRITKLPSEIQHLKNLQILRLDHNELTSLPSEIGSLFNLEQLTVSSNKLKSLPNSIGDLRKLQHLDLRFNDHLRSLPVTIYKNKRLESLLLDHREWTEPPTSIVRESTQAIISYFAQKSGSDETDELDDTKSEDLSTVESLHHLNIYDKFIQDNLRRLEKEKEEKLLKKIEMEKSLFNLKETELFLRQQSQCEKQKLIETLSAEQRRIDEEILKCHKRKEEEQINFIRQLQSVENKADDVIEQLLETCKAQKEMYVSSIISSLMEDIPPKQNLHQQKVLESMESLIAEEYFLSLKLQESDVARNKLIQVSNLNDKQLENKIVNSLSARRNEQNSLIECIKKDTDLQYAAVLMLIEKSDYRNIELQNQISVIQNQLSNLTALELQNRNLHMSKYVNELAGRRVILTSLLQDIFAQQQSRQKQLIDQLREVENYRSSLNKNEYWLIQFQRILNSNDNSLSTATNAVDSGLIYELALFGVSHYTPLLSTFELKSANGLSEITDAALEKVGINSAEDRQSILKAIKHFITDKRRENVLPKDSFLHCDYNPPSTSSTEVKCLELSNSITPTAPSVELIDDSQSISSLNEVLQNECVICLENQSNIVFLPCGHLCSCSTCSLSVNQCPLCRCDIESKMQIFRV